MDTTTSAASSDESDSHVTPNMTTQSPVVTRFEEALLAALLRIPTTRPVAVDAADFDVAA